METASTLSSESNGGDDDWKNRETVTNRDSDATSILSHEFDDIKDEVELGKMMGEDGEKLLALVDNIRKIDSLRNEEIYIPQIVVIGDTSSGKSSVLQALTRLPFPVAGELCTRFVTETTIRRCGPSEKPGYKIEVRMVGSQAAPFLPKIFESDEWVEVYQNLRKDINDAFDKLGPNPAPQTLNKANYQSSSTNERADPIPQLQKHRLQVTVRKPNQAHFSIVDIPGIVRSGAPADIELSTELVRQYIRNQEAIVLAVSPATNVIVNQSWFNLVTEEKALDRTIGVITKIDQINKADYEISFDLLRNRAGSEHYLKLGWFALRNRDSQEVIDGDSFEKRDRKEAEFFGNGKWQEATARFPSRGGAINPKVLGIQHLKYNLQGHLYRRVEENFPGLRAKMRSLENEYNEKLRSMGEPREKPRDQRVYLSGIQTTYEAEVERSLNGDYRFREDPNHPSRLRYHVKRFNEEFEFSIGHNAIKYPWQFNDQDNDGGGILAWIDSTWDAHRGSEPRHDAPRSLKKELVKQQTEAWESKAKLYIEQVEDAIKACNHDLFAFACKDFALRLKIRNKLEAQERKVFEDAHAELQNIFKDREYIDSWNPLLGLFIIELQRPRMERQVNLQAAQPKKDLSEDQVSTRELFYRNNKRVYEVHDWLCAYWRVAYPRFVDNVIIQVVERHLLGPRGPLRLFDRNWILELEDEELEDLAGESEETRAARRDLKERLDGLRKALEQADNTLNSRIGG